MIITQMITLFLCLTDQSVLSCVDINIDEHCMVELGPQLEDFVLKLLVELLSQLIVRLYAAVLINLKMFWTIPYSKKRQAANGTGIMYPKCSCSFLVEFLKQFHRPKKKKKIHQINKYWTLIIRLKILIQKMSTSPFAFYSVNRILC